MNLSSGFSLWVYYTGNADLTLENSAQFRAVCLIVPISVTGEHSVTRSARGDRLQ